MIRHAFRKFFLLTIVYCAVILGIFMLQFRHERILNKNAGSLRLTLYENAAPGQDAVLANNFQVAYKGIVFSGDSRRPVTEVSSDGTRKPAVLKSYNIEESALDLTFESGSRVSFSSISSGENETILITSVLADSVSQILLPCRAASGFAVENNESLQVSMLSSKDVRYAFSSMLTGENELAILNAAAPVSYSEYKPKTEITYQLLAASALAQESVFQSSINQFKAGFIQTMNAKDKSSASEKEIVAYISENEFQGKFSSVINPLNNSMNASHKTYLSVPYFGKLEAMNRTMVSYNNNLLYKAQQALSKNILSAFEIDHLLLVLYYKNRIDLANKLFELASLEENASPTVLQSAGLLTAYCDSYQYSAAAARKLEPAIERLLKRIIENVKFEENILTLAGEYDDYSQSDVCRLGMALINYGKIAKNDDYTKTGYLLVNSSLTVSPVQESTVYADLYPVLTQNAYYPHLVLLAQNPTPVTIWTTSPNVTLTSPEKNKLVLSIEFPVGESHYMIVTGLHAFDKIQMYGLNYRSDKQFELYNSPGYIYDFETKTLYLKMRHKSEIERVIFTYSDSAAAAAGALGI
ncbi:MAG: hypothetical protein IKK38_05765 [Spirochaetaceae bacterium]|nr:hypothetical protein [Spirochaetaceae bacterium]